MAGTTTGVLTNLIRDAKQPSMCKESKRNPQSTELHILGNTHAELSWRLLNWSCRILLIPLLLTLPFCWVLTTPSQTSKTPPFWSHPSHQLSRSSRKRSPPWAAMISSPTTPSNHHLPIISYPLTGLRLWIHSATCPSYQSPIMGMWFLGL